MAHSITDAEFEAEVLQSSLPVLVDFWAPWCGPCKAMLPILEGIETTYANRLNVVKVNVDESTEVAGNFSVMSIPTFIIFKSGKAVATFVGARSSEDLKKEIDAAIG